MYQITDLNKKILFKGVLKYNILKIKLIISIDNFTKKNIVYTPFRYINKLKPCN